MANSFNKYFFEMAESTSNALPSLPDEQHYLNLTIDSHPNTTNQQDHHRHLYAATEAAKNTTSVAQ
jgi:phage regulator Rha-like protein